MYTDHETTEDVILIQLEEMYSHWRKMARALGLENMIGAIEKHYGCVSHPVSCCEAYYRGFDYMWRASSPGSVFLLCVLWAMTFAPSEHYYRWLLTGSLVQRSWNDYTLWKDRYFHQYSSSMHVVFHSLYIPSYNPDLSYAHNVITWSLELLIMVASAVAYSACLCI